MRDQKQSLGGTRRSVVRLALPVLASVGLAVVISGRSIAAESQAPAAKDESKLRADYKVISDRNIFSRNRPTNRPTFTGPRQPEVRPQQRYMLVGIRKLIGPEMEPDAAFIEDGRTGNTVTVHVGESIAGGMVTKVEEKYIEYESEGQTRTIEVGMNFLRENLIVRGDPTPPTTQPTVAGATAPGLSPAAGDAASTAGSGGGEDDMVAKLKARRAAEMKGREE